MLGPHLFQAIVQEATLMLLVSDFLAISRRPL